MKTVAIVVAVVLLVLFLWWSAVSMKRKFSFNVFYKSEVEKMIAPLEHRIRVIEEAMKDGGK